jgi:hypothetical protein
VLLFKESPNAVCTNVFSLPVFVICAILSLIGQRKLTAIPANCQVQAKEQYYLVPLH